MSKRDFYDILGVDRQADDGVIKRAYRELAMRYHPDRNQGNSRAESLFKEAAEAYEVLSDPSRRRAYDRFGHDGVGPQGGMGAGFSSVDDIFGQFGDIFEDFFGFRKNEGKPRKGKDIEVELDVAFEEAIFGANREIALDRKVECDSCDGTGANPGATIQMCPSCDGDGQVTINQGIFNLTQTCTRCGGIGELIDDPCIDCGGRGERMVERSVTIRIPAGVGDGTKLRVPKAGLPGINGGAPGDAMVILRVQPHPHFERDGLDLFYDAPISFVQAALGCTVSVPTLDTTTVALPVPAGTQHGDTAALEGLGVRHHKGVRVGNLIVRFSLETPTELDDERRALLERFAELSGLDVDPS